MKHFVLHPLEPVYNENSKVLILGTMPSPKSREMGFYYSHPQNRFWRVLSEILQQELPNSREEKKLFLLRHRIALWDVLKSCEISGASDSTIKKPIVNDLEQVLGAAEIRAIFTTGKKAGSLYQIYCFPQTQREAICLPSTSPANCACRYEELLRRYQEILVYLK